MKCLDGRARAVGRQLQEVGCPSQVTPPIGYLLVDCRALHALALPDGVIGVLQW